MVIQKEGDIKRWGYKTMVFKQFSGTILLLSYSDKTMYKVQIISTDRDVFGPLLATTGNIPNRPKVTNKN